MKRKIITISIIGLFITMGTTSIFGLKLETSGENVVDLGTVITMDKISGFLFFSKPDFKVEETTATLENWDPGEYIMINMSSELEPFGFIFDGSVVDIEFKAKLGDRVLETWHDSFMGTYDMSYLLTETDSINHGDTIDLHLEMKGQLYSSLLRMTFEGDPDEGNNVGICSFTIQ